MRSTFFGVELARLALWSNQRAMDVTGHNVANANTEGYSRQVVSFATAPPHTAPAALAGQVGSGVLVRSIDRVHSAFLDRQTWSVTSKHEFWGARRQVLRQVEGAVNEPSDAGIRAALDRWWDAWAMLATEPQEPAARTTVLERTETLINVFREVDRRLGAIEDELDDRLGMQVERVNGLAQQIASLNERVIRAESGGQEANDLRDRRARLVTTLSRYVDLRAQETPAGGLRVSVGGVDLVKERGVRLLEVGTVSGQAAVRWAAEGMQADVTGGRVGAVLQLLNQDVASRRADLLDMAQRLSDAVNPIHENGFGLDGSTGNVFFDVPAGGLSTLDQWRVNPALVGNPDALAASQTGAPGDGANAQAVADVGGQALFGTATLGEHFRAWVADLGVAVEEARQSERTQGLLLEQVSAEREQVAGVSLDEEMVNMQRYQRAYDAAARVLTSADEMLEVLINRTGVVGR